MTKHSCLYITVAAFILCILYSCSTKHLENEALLKHSAAIHYYKQGDYIKAEKSATEALELWIKFKNSESRIGSDWSIEANINNCLNLIEILPTSESLNTKTDVPIKVINTSCYVDATLNERLNVTLLLDTGATSTIISPGKAKILGISPTDEDPIYTVMVFGGEKIKVPFVSLEKIKVGGSLVKNLMIGVYEDLPYASNIHGVLGTDFLNFFKMSIDQQNRILTLMPQNKQRAEIKKSLIGRWEGASNGEIGVIDFMEDGRVDFIESGLSLTESLSKNGGYLEYAVDTSKHPHHLDIIFISNSGAEITRLKMIFKYLSQNQIKVRTDFNGDRPLNFTSNEDENTIILIKKIDG